ncbi:unnamed protein product [Closterium sp. Naga37s-1]|nr:unnamed protein product [Closterium sp. Naga37s-1]
MSTREQEPTSSVFVTSKLLLHADTRLHLPSPHLSPPQNPPPLSLPPSSTPIFLPMPYCPSAEAVCVIPSNLPLPPLLPALSPLLTPSAHLPPHPHLISKQPQQCWFSSTFRVVIFACTSRIPLFRIFSERPLPCATLMMFFPQYIPSHAIPSFFSQPFSPTAAASDGRVPTGQPGEPLEWGSQPVEASLTALHPCLRPCPPHPQQPLPVMISDGRVPAWQPSESLEWGSQPLESPFIALHPVSVLAFPHPPQPLPVMIDFLQGNPVSHWRGGVNLWKPPAVKPGDILDE